MGQEVAQVETSGWVTRGEEEDFEAACQGCTTLIRSATRAQHGLQNRAQIRICVPATRISFQFSLEYSLSSFSIQIIIIIVGIGLILFILSIQCNKQFGSFVFTYFYFIYPLDRSENRFDLPRWIISSRAPSITAHHTFNAEKRFRKLALG